MNRTAFLKAYRRGVKYLLSGGKPFALLAPPDASWWHLVPLLGEPRFFSDGEGVIRTSVDVWKGAQHPQEHTEHICLIVPTGHLGDEMLARCVIQTRAHVWTRFSDSEGLTWAVDLSRRGVGKSEAFGCVPGSGGDDDAHVAGKMAEALRFPPLPVDLTPYPLRDRRAPTSR